MVGYRWRAEVFEPAVAAIPPELHAKRAPAELFVAPGEQVYEGMVIGEASRPGDMVVNAVREKEKTNIRTHSHDEGLRLTPPPPMTLESAIEFIAADELVEITPSSIRLRKRILSQHGRRRAAGREYELGGT